MKYLAFALIVIMAGCSNQTNTLSSKEIIASTMPAPKYPINAARKGIEGYVELKFDIDEEGHTQNISIVNSSPKDIFDESAISTVTQWRFTRKIIDNAPVYQRDQSTKLEFNLGKSKTSKHDHVIKDAKMVKGIQKTFSLVNQGDLEQALSVSLSLKPTSQYEQAFIIRIIGMIYADLGDADKAIIYLTNAVNSNHLDKNTQESTVKRLAEVMAKNEINGVK